ncbi:MAG: hypothetical protein AOA65_1056 [Candidatus Bathyarchaeota archaeon BA1]|nr:MAG: hypothetical protein AOA65_1056 [Candidatus Bathyarchaeota archaeon BA1]
MKVVGIDLSGVESKGTGFCVLDDMDAKTSIVYADKEIVEKTHETKPKVVAIDAPLALPKGRRSLEERSNVHLRQCDRELLRMGIKFFPITLGPMRKLTERGIRLRRFLEEEGFEVIEVYPGAAQDILKMPRKQKGIEKLRKALIEYGLKGDVNKECITDHELDAITSALVGKLYLEGKAVSIGDPEEILMIIPLKKKEFC